MSKMVGDRDRLAFVDVARGWALVLMVVNHTARYWLDQSVGDIRTGLIYLTTTLAAPSFLFLAGFVFPISWSHTRNRVAKYLARAAKLIVAGYFVNAVVFPQEPLLGSNILHTIGAAMLVGLLIVPLLERRGARLLVIGIAAIWAGAFWLMLPSIERWIVQHPRAALVLFYDFPAWPWLSIVLLGIVAGSAMRTAQRPVRVIVALGAIGMLGVLGAAATWGYDAKTLSFTRDVVLNGHWVPRGAMVAWVVGAAAATLAAAWWLTEVARLQLRWLRVLGSTALALYVVHLLLVVNLAHRALGIRRSGWLEFWVATAGLIAALVVIGMAWLALKSIVRKRIASRAGAQSGDPRAFPGTSARGTLTLRDANSESFVPRP
jgi:uncharacterized membrane protein